MEVVRKDTHLTGMMGDDASREFDGIFPSASPYYASRRIRGGHAMGRQAGGSV